jgi:polyferredoxin
LQIECVSCTACIDACDEMMDKVERERGLIRYTSQVALAGRATRWIRPRTVLYSILLCAGIGVASWALSTVRPAAMSVTRMIGSPFFLDAESVRNQFMVRIVNKQGAPVTFEVEIDDVPRGVTRTGFEQPVEVPALGEIVQPLVLRQSRGDYQGQFHVDIEVRDQRRSFELKRRVEFVGPEADLLHAEDARASGKPGAGGRP